MCGSLRSIPIWPVLGIQSTCVPPQPTCVLSLPPYSQPLVTTVCHAGWPCERWHVLFGFFIYNVWLISSSMFPHASSKDGISFFMAEWESMVCVLQFIHLSTVGACAYLLLWWLWMALQSALASALLWGWFHFLWMTTWKQMTRSHGGLTFRHLGAFRTILHDRGTHLHSYQWCTMATWEFSSPHILTSIGICLLIIAILVGEVMSHCGVGFHLLTGVLNVCRLSPVTGGGVLAPFRLPPPFLSSPSPHLLTHLAS